MIFQFFYYYTSQPFEIASYVTIAESVPRFNSTNNWHAYNKTEYF